MFRRPVVWLVTLLALAACARGAQQSQSSQGGGKGTTCDLSHSGLGAAHAVTMWSPPSGCHAEMDTAAPLPPSNGRMSVEVRRARVACDGSAASSNETLFIASAHDFPARAGDEVVDDGTTVTIIRDQRSPCPGEPPGMGPDYTLVFSVPADRSFAETVCNVERSCR